MLDFLRNHAGFTAAGAGKHEQRPAEVFDGGLLLGVKFHGERVGECVRKNYITAIETGCKEEIKGRLKTWKRVELAPQILDTHKSLFRRSVQAGFCMRQDSAFSIFKL